MDPMMNVVLSIGSVIIGVLVILGYFKTKEKDRIAEMTAQREADERQNQKIAILEQRVTYIESNAKELKGEILEKVEKLDTKVDDLKHMLIKFFTHNT